MSLTTRTSKVRFEQPSNFGHLFFKKQVFPFIFLRYLKAIKSCKNCTGKLPIFFLLSNIFEVRKKWQNAISVPTSTFSNDKYLTCGFLSKKVKPRMRRRKIFHLLLRLPEHRCQVFLLTCTLARCSSLLMDKYTG